MATSPSNLADIVKALFVGQGGAMMTPEELANQRLLLSKRMGTTDTSPVGHWSAGAARMVDALGDVFQQRRLDGISRELAGEDKAAQGLLGQIVSGLYPGAATAPTGVTSPASAATVATVSPTSAASPSPVQPASAPPAAPVSTTPASSSSGTPPASLGILEYTNSAAKRNLPLQAGLASNIEKAVSTVYGDGYKVQVYSGGQGEGSRGRVGSTRHDDGHAGDVYIVGPDGKRVTGDRLAPLAQYWTANKLGGVGLEMRGGGIHLDGHTDRAPTWNYANQGGSYTPAQQDAIAAGLKGVQPTLASPGATQAAPAATQPAAAQAPQSAPTAAPSANQIPQLLAMANNPRLAEGTRKIATSLLGQQMTAAKEAAERARTQVERTQAATVLGINPAYAVNEDVWKSAVGEHFKTTTAAPGSSIVRGGQIVGSVPQAPMTVAPNTTVLDPNTRQPIFTAPAAPTPEMQNYQAQQQMPGFAAAERQKRFDDAAVPQQVKMFGEVQTSGATARQNVARIDVLDKLLSESPSGAPASMVAMAGRMGINLGKDTSNIQAANAIINQLVPAQREPGSGPMSDRDIDLFRSSLPQLINTREGNQKIISTMRAIAQYDVLRGNIANDVLNGRMSPSQGRDALMNLENPLANFQPARESPAQGGQRRTSSGVTWSVN